MMGFSWFMNNTKIYLSLIFYSSWEKNNYTDEEVDDVRAEWAMYVSNFV